MVKVDTALILAAGLGTRMGELTKTRPKALLEVGGKCLIDRLLDALADEGVSEAVVNLHHHADMAEAYLKTRKGLPHIKFSDERAELLETGGGMVKALPLLPKDAPFFVVNSDVLMTGGSPYQALTTAWRDADMDCLLLLIPRARATGHKAAGDFFMDKAGRLTRRGGADSAPYVFSGIRLAHPRLAQGHQVKPFSFNVFFDEAIAKGRLFGVVFDGDWIDVGTKDALMSAGALLS